jgi:hypothetical protein
MPSICATRRRRSSTWNFFSRISVSRDFIDRYSPEVPKRGVGPVPAWAGGGRDLLRAWSMMPKSAKRFPDDIMLQFVRIDHAYGLGSVRSKIVVIWHSGGV